MFGNKYFISNYEFQWKIWKWQGLGGHSQILNNFKNNSGIWFTSKFENFWYNKFEPILNFQMKLSFSNITLVYWQTVKNKLNINSIKVNIYFFFKKKETCHIEIYLYFFYLKDWAFQHSIQLTHLFIFISCSLYIRKKLVLK